MTSPAPYSYRQYAGNGTTKDFVVPFPYIERAHVHVYLGFDLLDGTFTSELAETTGFIWTSNTGIRTVVAPATGTTLTVIRRTPNFLQLVEWVDGSNLIAADLNTSDLQNLYVVQEQQDRNDSGISLTIDSTAESAEALAKANQAIAESGTALSQSNTALSQSTTALSQSTTALSNSSTALSQSTTALSTANEALSKASDAVITSNSADIKADAAIAAVANSVNYTAIANVAGIPATPGDNTYIEIADSTGLESFTPLTGKPAGFIGDPGLSVRLRYTDSPATWNWVNYYATNSEARYLKLAGGTLTGPLVLAGPPTAPLNPATKAYTDAADATLTTAAANAQSTANAANATANAAESTANAANATANAANATANTALPKAGGTMTGNIVFAGSQPTATTAAAGIVQLNTATNSTSTTTAATPASVKSVQDFAQAVSTASSTPATETVKGIVELATAQEAWDRADATRAVSPISLNGTYIRNDHRGQAHGYTGTNSALFVNNPIVVGGDSTDNSVVYFAPKNTPGTARAQMYAAVDNTFFVGRTGAGGVWWSLAGGGNLNLNGIISLSFVGRGALGVQHENAGHEVTFRATATGNGLFYSTSSSGGWVGIPVSDKRIKALAPTQRRAYPHSPGLDLIEQLRPVRFNYDQNRPLSLPDGQRWGFLAQDLQAILPEAVREISEPNALGDGTPFDDAIPDLLAFESDAAYQLIAVLTSAVQELIASNAALAARITTLEGGAP
jgi:hypothetical protein